MDIWIFLEKILGSRDAARENWAKHALQLSQSVQQGRVVGAHQHRVVPAGGADDGPFGRSLAVFASHSCGHLFHRVQIFLADGQVGGVDFEALLPSALDASVGEPARGMVDGVGRALLVLQCVSVDVVFAPRISHLGAVAGTGFEGAGEHGEKYVCQT